MLLRRMAVAAVCTGVVGVVAFLALAWQPALPLVDPPAPASFSRDVVGRGETLASAGNCVTCHTTEGGGRLAGGRPLPTPFGIIYSTNITPDRDTGIGRWSEAAFTRAMREGVGRNGRHLFPAFPYDHFAKLSDADVNALYAYLMTVPSVAAPALPNTLPFPLDVRALQAAWKALYFTKGTYQPESSRSAEWNRGAYLIEGVAHCGACHTPRNIFGAEQKGHPLAGAPIDGWAAWPLDVSPSPARWSKEDFAAYLRGGTIPQGRAIGPMGEVVANLSKLPDADIQAIATYLAALNRPFSAEPDVELARTRARATATPDQARDRGARLYVSVCSSCHGVGAATPMPGRVDLSLSTALWHSKSHVFARVVLNGVGGPTDAPGPMMPAFRDMLSDADIAAIGNYLRRSRTNQPPWPQIEGIASIMRENPRLAPWTR